MLELYKTKNLIVNTCILLKNRFFNGKKSHNFRYIFTNKKKQSLTLRCKRYHYGNLCENLPLKARYVKINEVLSKEESNEKLY